MKNLIFFSLTFLLIASCTRDTIYPGGPPKPPTAAELFAASLDGSWNVVQVDYYTALSIPIIGDITAEGTAEDAGTFAFSNANKTCTYNISFTTEPLVIGGFPIAGLPINMKGSGGWENTAKYVIITLESGEDAIFKVITDEASKKVLSGTLPYTYLGQTVDVDVEMTLTK